MQYSPIVQEDRVPHRMTSPPGSTPGILEILEILGASSGVLNVTVLPGSARYPDGDVVECDLDPASG